MPINADNIFHFPEGIPAFENAKEFVFIHKPDVSPFIFMHAVKPKDLAFVCIDPFIIFPDYRPRISEADAGALHLASPADLLLLSIVTIAKDPINTTANLQGPIAINIQASIGKQIICENQGYPIRFKIWEALEKAAQCRSEKANELVLS
jgi:flagellar assembly factor FliW